MAQFYLVKNGQRVGPFELEQLAQQELTPETLAWTEGMANWEPAGSIPALASIFAPKPAPAPAPQPAPAPAPAPAPQPVQQAAPQPQYVQEPQAQYQQPYQQQSAMGNYAATPQMGFMDAVKTCFKKYFDFSGRARRSEFWWFNLAIFIVNGVIMPTILGIAYFILKSSADSKAEELSLKISNSSDFNQIIEIQNQAQAAINSYNSTFDTILIIWGIVFVIILLALFIPMLSATARRLHDVGKSGHLQWLYLLCGIGGPICLILCIPDGDPKPNQYGESPKYVSIQE